jgi:hypothetical protein
MSTKTIKIFIKSKINQATNRSNSSTDVGIDDVYAKIIKKIGNVAKIVSIAILTYYTLSSYKVYLEIKKLKNAE